MLCGGACTELIKLAFLYTWTNTPFWFIHSICALSQIASVSANSPWLNSFSGAFKYAINQLLKSCSPKWPYLFVADGVSDPLLWLSHTFVEISGILKIHCHHFDELCGFQTATNPWRPPLRLALKAIKGCLRRHASNWCQKTFQLLTSLHRSLL